MTQKQILDTASISAAEHREMEKFRNLSLHGRGQLLMVACRAAVKIEDSRLRMGLPPTEPAPWPESTWKFLAEATRRVRTRTPVE